MRRCAAPTPCTETPAFTPPPGACDAHCHVFGPARRFPYHPGRSYTPPDAPYEALRALHEVLGFERAVLVQASCHGTDNRALVDALERAGGACRGVAMVEPGVSEDELARLDRAGVRGLRFSHARHIGGAPDFAAVAALAGTVAPLGWHLELYLEPEDLVAHADDIAALPLPVVIDHMARVDPRAGPAQAPFRLLRELVATAGVWVKVSCLERLSAHGYPYSDAVPLAQALIEAAPERVLWGSDWPHPNMDGRMPDDGALVELLPVLAPDAARRRALLVDNPERLYGFGASDEVSTRAEARGRT